MGVLCFCNVMSKVFNYWVSNRVGHEDKSADAHHPHKPHILHMSQYSAHMSDRHIFRNRMADAPMRIDAHLQI